MERKEIIEILRVGLKAASPYNGQPWEFQFKDDRLLIFAQYIERGFLGNFRNVILYSLGALLENLSEGARHFHYDLTYRLLTIDIQNHAPLCEVSFKKTADSGYYDIRHIMERYTNRKIYRPQPVSPAVLEKIRSTFQGGTREVLNVTGNETFINTCALLERVRVANLEFNEELIDILCFSPKEAEERRRGLDLRVLELPFYAQLFLQAERNAFFRRTVGRSFIAQRSAESSKRKALHGCPLLIAFKNPDDSAETVVRDWMMIQKIINTLHKDGLSSHLLASSVDLTKVKRAFYMPAERKILDQADATIQKALGIRMQSILTLLRVGYADECEFKALRVNPEDLLLP